MDELIRGIDVTSFSRCFLVSKIMNGRLGWDRWEQPFHLADAYLTAL
jgi:hypothetical protein